MKFKEFWKISTKSEEPDLKEAFSRQTKKKYEPLVQEASHLDLQMKLVRVLKEVLGELDPKQDKESILDLEYIIRLYREWADLNQEILTNLKIVDKSEVLEKEEEWKKNTEYEKKEYALESQNHLVQEAIESMKSRIKEIQEEIEAALQDFEEKAPQVFDRCFELSEQQPKENRTN